MHTKFANNCTRWFLYNKTENPIQYDNLCFQYDANVEYSDDV